MQVQELMTRDVELTDPNTSIREIAKAMRSKDIGAVPVGENDRLIGMVTDRDIVMRAVAEEQAWDSTTARDVMSEKVYYCFEDDNVAEAAQTMGQHQVRRLPVLNRDKRLVGIVVLADIGRSGDDAAKHALAGITEPSSFARAT
jgi:CBS domain-containing protein